MWKTLQSCDYFGLCTHLTGAHYTNDVKQKFLDVDNLCPHCTLQCEALSYVRAEWDNDTWTIAKELTTTHYGMLKLPEEFANLRLCIPIGSVLPDLPRAIDDLTEIIVFILCQHPIHCHCWVGGMCCFRIPQKGSSP